ncbi:hypothetical protein DFH07DRAFT_813913 [Mycena maculata]|uniref:F-box domain-containing protein n=1 Tax=Mycena maculata TaxID=230809 RepID=A0AAD7JFH8_9AGAR|nr:hypothetical protein DFH07DRAFT_813913 [Mycena maculata]
MAQRILSRFKYTNLPPSEFEAIQVWEVGDEARVKLSSVEAQISRQQGRPGSHWQPQIRALQRDGASLRQTLDLCRSILSPIRLIPSEILTHIFAFTIPLIEDARKVDWDKSLEQTPWILGQISGHWRAVALALPILWTSIIIRRTNDDSDPCSIPMLETQLLRSRTSPLDVVFDIDGWGDQYVVQQALSALVKCSSRWKSLYIAGEQLARLPRIRGRVPILEKLCVWGVPDPQDEDYGNSPPPDYMDHFEIAPRLRDLEVKECFPWFKVPWRQLARSRAGGHWDAHISALVQLKNVESCRFMLGHECDIHDPFTWGSKTHEIPTLRQLMLFCERRDSGEYWTCPPWLTLPGLTDLSIDADMLRGLPRLLQASKFPLRRLHLTGSCPRDLDLVRPVFQSSPDLIELLINVIERCWLPPCLAPLFSLLTLQPGKSALLPKLEHIIVVALPSHQDDVLGDMIVSRCSTTGGASRLRSVTIHGEGLGANLASKLDGLRSHGLSVRAHRSRRESKLVERNYGESEDIFGYYSVQCEYYQF